MHIILDKRTHLNSLLPTWDPSPSSVSLQLPSLFPALAAALVSPPSELFQLDNSRENCSLFCCCYLGQLSVSLCLNQLTRELDMRQNKRWQEGPTLPVSIAASGLSQPSAIMLFRSKQNKPKIVVCTATGCTDKFGLWQNRGILKALWNGMWSKLLDTLWNRRDNSQTSTLRSSKSSFNLLCDLIYRSQTESLGKLFYGAPSCPHLNWGH